MEKTAGNLRYLPFYLFYQSGLFHNLLFSVETQLAELVRASSKNLTLIRKKKWVLATSAYLPDPCALSDELGNNSGQISSVFQIYISAQLAKGAWTPTVHNSWVARHC